jgi:hypothetical protein
MPIGFPDYWRKGTGNLGYFPVFPAIFFAVFKPEDCFMSSPVYSGSM